MSFFNEYPYRNITDLNLDWLIGAIRTLRHDVDDFVTMNAIKYADPIDWSITTQYEKNTVVIDANTGVAYLSVAAVPAGVNITRPEYWSVIFDLSRFLNAGVSNLANSYESQLTYNATVPTDTGNWVVWNGTLYEALNDIHIGDRYVPDSNIKKTTVEDFVSRVITAINTEIQNRIDADTTLQGHINDEVQARQDADTTLQGHINDEVQARHDADTTLQGHINDEVQARQDAVSAEVQARQDADGVLSDKIGNLNDLQTTNKNSTVDAINEIDNRLEHLVVESVLYNVVDHGADNTGANDCLSVINDGLSSGMIVYFPKGIYKISDTIELTTGQSIIGEAQNDFDSANGTIIKIANDSADAIRIVQGAQYVTIRNLTIDRITSATPTGDGVHVNQGSNIHLTNVHSQNHNHGFYLSATGWSYIKECIARKNFSHGFMYENTAISGALQWQTLNCLAELNDGTGFYVHGVTNSFNVVTTGIFDGICTFANKAYGVFVYGDTEGVNAVRITNAFIGNDTAGAIRLLPRGAVGGIIDSCYIEIAGMSGSGRNEDSAINVNAVGIAIDDDSKDYVISNCHVVSCQGDGISCRNDKTIISNCLIHNNGLGGSGVGIRQVLGKMIIANNIVRDNPTSQIYFTSDTKSNVIANIVSSAILYAGGHTNINDAYNILT